ncbi:hypothetical protein MYX34_07025 [Borreliella burgdorferi]|nr:hypothetical protein [Borreliella burgdorferi]
MVKTFALEKYKG